LYPLLRKGVAWFVDSMVLKRVDYDELRVEIAQAISAKEDAKSILESVCERLAAALTARTLAWVESEESNRQEGTLSRQIVEANTRNDYDGSADEGHKQMDPAKVNGAGGGQTVRLNDRELGEGATTIVPIPTVDSPQFNFLIGELAAGRRLMSDDLAMLDAVALLTARAIDRVRVAHERCERDLREEQISKLVTEAELRALRAQINPHFLFNALTTIGYLIEAAPDRALAALLRLTVLLRGTLHRSSSEFTTLGQEIDLVETYLEIERARYEEKLRIIIDVPPAERIVRIPSLLVQPLVENAVKHGIAPLRSGGEISVRARLLEGALHILVRDTGAGTDQKRLAVGRAKGVGLANIEHRLRCHYGEQGVLKIDSKIGLGTEVEIRLPVSVKNESVHRETSTTSAGHGVISE
ncbi:MAG: sensor histidine kinase, partial [Blastocatellia bacterium]